MNICITCWNKYNPKYINQEVCWKKCKKKETTFKHRCKTCKELFYSQNRIQTYCNPKCYIASVPKKKMPISIADWTIYELKKTMKDELWYLYCEYCGDFLNWIKISWKFKLVYILYPWDNRTKDTNNILSVSDKFFQDALVNYWCIKDDNYKFNVETVFKFWEVQKWKWRVEVEIFKI